MGRPLIIDANNLIVRAAMTSALDDLKSGGVYTGGMYGALQSLRALVKTPDFNVGRIIAFFDHSTPPYRRALIPTYKEDRETKRELLSEDEMEKVWSQIDKSYELWPSLGIQCLAYRAREADDCVAAAVRLLAEADPLVISGDKDLYQCVGMGASVWDLSRKILVDADNFYDEAGDVLPETYVLFRTLTGDSSDSIKGAFGCGKKRAPGLIQATHEWDDAQEELPPAFDDLDPWEQLDRVVAYVGTLDAPRKWETAVAEEHQRLRKVARGIDLRDSFGNVAVLAEELQDPPALDALGFLRACKGYGMKSVLGDAKGWLEPFQAAQKRT